MRSARRPRPGQWHVSPSALDPFRSPPQKLLPQHPARKGSSRPQPNSRGSRESVPVTHEAEGRRLGQLCRRTEAMIPSCGRTRHRASYSDRQNGGTAKSIADEEPLPIPSHPLWKGRPATASPPLMVRLETDGCGCSAARPTARPRLRATQRNPLVSRDLQTVRGSNNSMASMLFLSRRW
jgi:hypothetical protein